MRKTHRKQAKFLIIAVVISLCISISGCGKTARTPSSPLFYKISNGDTIVYVLGSIHVASDDIYPLPDEIMSAYASCESVMLEVDFSTIPSEERQLFTRGESVELVGEAALNDAEQIIRDNYSLLSPHMDIDLDGLKQADIFQISMYLSSLAAYKAELYAEYGIDFFFLQRAVKDRKVLLGAETYQQQSDDMAQLPGEYYKWVFENYLDIDSYVEQTKSLFEVWRTGDGEAVENIELIPLRHMSTQSDMGKAAYAWFLERNQRMLDSIAQCLNSEGNTFVVIGLAHVVGEEGVIAQLEKADYHIEQVIIE